MNYADLNYGEIEDQLIQLHDHGIITYLGAGTNGYAYVISAHDDTLSLNLYEAAIFLAGANAVLKAVDKT